MGKEVVSGFDVEFIGRLPVRRGRTSLGRRKGLWEEGLEPVRARPGQWAKVRSWPADKAKNAEQAQFALRNGRYHGVNKGEYETAVRLSADKTTADLYVKYVGKRSKKGQKSARWTKAELDWARDMSLTNAEVAEKTGRSTKAAWNMRVKLLAAGEITDYARGNVGDNLPHNKPAMPMALPSWDSRPGLD